MNELTPETVLELNTKRKTLDIGKNELCRPLEYEGLWYFKEENGIPNIIGEVHSPRKMKHTKPMTHMLIG